MTYANPPTGRAFWYAHAREQQVRAAECAEDARHYADLDGAATTLARALQFKASHYYKIARAAVDAGDELPA